MGVSNSYCVHCDRQVTYRCTEASKTGCTLYHKFEAQRHLDKVPYQDKGGRLNGPDDKTLAARELAAQKPRGPDDEGGCMADFDKAETERQIRDALNGGPLKNNEPPKLKPNPADEPYAYAEPDKHTVTDAVLLHYGYAPGEYVLRCKDCQELKQGNSKYNQRCRECAEKQYWHDANAKMAEPPIIVSVIDDAYKVDLKTPSMAPPPVEGGFVSVERHKYEALKAELAEAVEHRGEALDLAEQWKADCLKAWARIEELQKQIIAYDKQVEALRSKR